MTISNDFQSEKTFALLDEGSTITIINKDLVERLKLDGKDGTIGLKGFRDAVDFSTRCKWVDFKIESEVGEFFIENAVSVSKLTLPSQSFSAEFSRYLAKTQGVFIQPYENITPQILIGQDNWRLIITREFREVPELDLVISLTRLGWIAHGVSRIKNFEASEFPSSVLTCQDVDKKQPCCHNFDELDRLIKDYFMTDSLGVREISRPNPEHARAMKILRETTRRTDNAWETGLLWKSDFPPKVDSRSTAYKRLVSLERKLDRDKSYADLYYAEMNRFIANGYAKRVVDDVNCDRIWYLPHFGVTNPSKPGRVRVVLDAAAKTCGISLNDQLETGPDFLQSLFGVLIRFRQYAVAFRADIKDMYLRVKVIEKDRGALRFLWRGDDRLKNPDEWEMTCIIFGANSSPTSALYVKDENAKTFAKTKPDASISVVRNSYMDDYLSSKPTCAQAEVLINDVRDINLAANFVMHSWASNHPQVLKGVTETGGVKNDKLQLCDRGGERVLGLFWDTKNDTLGFNVGLEKMSFELIDGTRKPTKREFLRCVMSVYDPLGLLTPFLLKSKFIMQDVWRSKVGWDDELREDQYVDWLKWVRSLSALKQFRVPRCLTPKHALFEKAQLHVFCDASIKAYAASIYVRFIVPDFPAHVALIMAKTKVASLKQIMTIPRLELQGALMAARLLNSVENELEIECEKRYLWSDSQTVLRWIETEPRTRQIFVAHRLGEIAELTKVEEWRWVPTKMNPADCATRGDYMDQNAIKMWLEGPEFLKNDEDSWPKSGKLPDSEMRTIDEMELRKAHVFNVTFGTKELPFVVRLFGWRGLIVVARRVIKAIFNRFKLVKLKSGVSIGKDVCDVDKMRAAESLLFRHLQAESFTEELESLRSRGFVGRQSKIANVVPFLDENGILRVRGRVTKLKGVVFENTPIILDSKHPAVILLIAEYHRRFLHASKETVLNEIRQKFFIIGLRNALKSLISKCYICKFRRGKPQNQIMAPLPEARVAYRQRPFTHCGVDYFGPMFVTVKRSTAKRWGALFTCLTTRAIHLEIAYSLTANSAIMAIQRLAARRGSPSFFYSDNGTNFKGACTELRDELSKLDRAKLNEYALKNGVKWIFNPPDAPHTGGSWERLIKSVKISLDAVMRGQILTDEVLYTVMTEIEHSVNSRPLTHVSVDPNDFEALTPNHFLIGTSSGEIKLGNYDGRFLSSKRQWQIAQSLADAFWERWLREYLPTLLPRKKWFREVENIKIGDLVLIVDLQLPRNQWRVGRVTNVFPGEGNIVRQAKIDCHGVESIRHVCKLVKIFNEFEVKNGS